MMGIVKLIVILSVWIGLVTAEAGTKDEQIKPQFNIGNTITGTQKPELLSYQQITQYGSRYPSQPVLHQQQHQLRGQYLQETTPYQQVPRKQILVPQHQPTPVAMIIIAQPAYIPASMLQNGNMAQQLLTYFHGNPQARYQLIHGNHPPQQYIIPVQSQQVPQYVHYPQQQQPIQYEQPAPTAQAQTSNYYQSEQQSQLPHHQVVAHHLPIPHQQNVQQSQQIQQVQHQQVQPVQQYHPQQQVLYQNQAQTQQTQQEKPLQLSHISQIAQQAAQHFLMSGGASGGSRTAPAVITGLENFSPEYQSKIKAQLSAHFGAPLQPFNLGGVQKSVMSPSTKYYQDQKQRASEEFVPSQQVKGAIMGSESEAEAKS